MTSVKSLATRFQNLKTGHAPKGVYLKCIRHREDDQGLWCGGTTAQTRENFVCHSSQWKEDQQEVGKAMDWKVNSFQNIQISELYSVETCDQVVWTS
jgi:hypothetical protein